MSLYQHTDICTCGQHLITNKDQSRFDPTHTVSLRNAFMHDMTRRFKGLAKEINISVKVNDCFGLKPVPAAYALNPKQFIFKTDQAKLDEFMIWLQDQVNKGILQTREVQQIGSALYSQWTNLYIEDSYKRGIIRARYEMIKSGYDVPSIDTTGGVVASMVLPFHLDRIGLLYSRTFNELKGITDSMAQTISRILAQGIADGDGPALLARKLVAAINGTGDTLALKDLLGRYITAENRALTLARTEIIRAHHVAMIQEYRNWGVVGVRVQAEWRTAGDDRVCDKCAQLEGKIFSLDEIEGMIPYHPNCRCLALPKLIE